MNKPQPEEIETKIKITIEACPACGSWAPRIRFRSPWYLPMRGRMKRKYYYVNARAHVCPAVKKIGAI